MFEFIIPVFGAALSWLILPGELPDLTAVIGMVLLAITLISVNLSAGN